MAATRDPNVFTNLAEQLASIQLAPNSAAIGEGLNISALREQQIGDRSMSTKRGGVERGSTIGLGHGINVRSRSDQHFRDRHVAPYGGPVQRRARASVLLVNVHTFRYVPLDLLDVSRLRGIMKRSCQYRHATG